MKHFFVKIQTGAAPLLSSPVNWEQRINSDSGNRGYRGYNYSIALNPRDISSILKALADREGARGRIFKKDSAEGSGGMERCRITNVATAPNIIFPKNYSFAFARTSRKQMLARYV